MGEMADMYIEMDLLWELEYGQRSERPPVDEDGKPIIDSPDWQAALASIS
jgi:hypothetical protein